MRNRLNLSLAVVVMFVTSTNLNAQSISGSFSGVVMDQQQAVMPGVAVRVRSLQTNAVRTTGTDDQGRFRLPNMPVGDYELTVEHAGFAKYVRSGIKLVLNQEAVVNIIMKPAEVSEVITVSGDAPLINTTNAEVGVNFDHKRITELPLSPNRNIITTWRCRFPGSASRFRGKLASRTAATPARKRTFRPFRQMVCVCGPTTS